MDGVSANAAFLACHVQFRRLQFVHVHYFQCLSGLLCAKRKEMLFLNPLKWGGHMLF